MVVYDLFAHDNVRRDVSPYIEVALWASGSEPTSMIYIPGVHLVSMRMHSCLCLQHRYLHTCQTIRLQLYTCIHSKANVCSCSRVPQCIYEMSVEKWIHCTSSLYFIYHWHPFLCLLLLDIENVWGCRTCDRIAEHCRTLSVGATAVYH